MKPDPSDYKFFKEEGDPGFNPDYNRFVIEKTIKEYEATRKKKRKAYEEKIRERADAVVTYMKSRVAEGGTPVEKYFGKKWLAYLQGRRILQRMKRLRDGTNIITLEEI